MGRWMVMTGALVATFAGCATANMTAPPTNAQIAAAEKSVAAARQERGPETDATAARHRQMAEEQLAEAKGRISQGDNYGATTLLARAQADAELSQMLQRRARELADARTTEEQLQQTRAGSISPETVQP